MSEKLAHNFIVQREQNHFNTKSITALVDEINLLRAKLHHFCHAERARDGATLAGDVPRDVRPSERGEQVAICTRYAYKIQHALVVKRVERVSHVCVDRARIDHEIE